MDDPRCADGHLDQAGVPSETGGEECQAVPGGDQGDEQPQITALAGEGPAEVLQQNGLRFSGHDDGGQVRIAELPGHPFYFATLFQPELAGDGTRPHPIITAFAAATVDAAGRSARDGRAGATSRAVEIL